MALTRTLSVATTTTLTLVAPTPPDPDCCASVCAYNPTRIHKILYMLEEMAQSGYEPSEALMGALIREMTPDAVEGESPYSSNRNTSLGPTEPAGAQIAADIWRALRAGKRNPQAISSYLCPLTSD